MGRDLRPLEVCQMPLDVTGREAVCIPAQDCSVEARETALALLGMSRGPTRPVRSRGPARGNGPVSVCTVFVLWPCRVCWSSVLWRPAWGTEPRGAVSAAATTRSTTRLVSCGSHPCSPKMSFGAV